MIPFACMVLTFSIPKIDNLPLEEIGKENTKFAIFILRLFPLFLRNLTPRN
jgi:hypothetical protein